MKTTWVMDSRAVKAATMPYVEKREYVVVWRDEEWADVVSRATAKVVRRIKVRAPSGMEAS